jgi:hypothetical protein
MRLSHREAVLHQMVQAAFNEMSVVGAASFKTEDVRRFQLQTAPWALPWKPSLNLRFSMKGDSSIVRRKDAGEVLIQAALQTYISRCAGSMSNIGTSWVLMFERCGMPCRGTAGSH